MGTEFRELAEVAALPFYSRPQVTLHLIITNDFKKSYERHGLGDCSARRDKFMEGVAIHWPSQLRFVVCMRYDYLTHNLIGHELEHVRARIVQQLGVRRKESIAEIVGWLHDWVYRVLAKHRVPIYHEPVEKPLRMPSNWQDDFSNNDDEEPF